MEPFLSKVLWISIKVVMKSTIGPFAPNQSDPDYFYTRFMHTRKKFRKKRTNSINEL